MKLVLLCSILVSLSLGCVKVDCSTLLRGHQNTYLNIKVIEASQLNRGIRILGIDPISNREMQFENGEFFFKSIRDSLTIGDTLFKQKDSLNYIVKKHNRNIVYPYTCDQEREILVINKGHQNWYILSKE